jgi:polyisoprenoid-binding protein YceI
MAPHQWEFDLARSSINFRVRHLMVAKVHGRFGKWTGLLAFDEATPASSRVEARIEAASIDTKDRLRDDNLRSAEFLDAAKYPELTFRSTSVEGTNGKFQVRGDLTVRGVSRPVVLETRFNSRGKDPRGGERAGFSARASISRRDFGLLWSPAIEAGGIAVGDKVEIEIEVEAVKAAPAKAS